MKHQFILEQLVKDVKADSNTLGLLGFGSVASGTHNDGSDIDVLLVYRSHDPTSGLEDEEVEGIKVGKIFVTYENLIQNIDTVPYLLHTIGNATLLFDRDNTIKPLIERIKEYFASNPEVEEEWNRIYDRLKEEKKQYGCEQTTILDVWNELERRYSGGELKRTFLRQFG